jgi:cell division protein FtsQ
VLAHNSVDRDVMARDSIELTQYDDVVPTPRARASRSANSELKLGTAAYSRILTDTVTGTGESDTDSDFRRRKSTSAKSRTNGVRNEDDSELLIHPEDFNLDDPDGDEAQFLRANKRVPVRRNAIPKKAADKLKILTMIAAGVVAAAALWGWAYNYGQHSWRFRIDSSDAVEITGVHNASGAHVMEVAGSDIGRNIFFVPLEERQKQLEQIPWVAHASVMRLLPNRLAVTIEERTPVAFAQIGSRISLIDAGGMVMGLPANRETKYSFPVIRGIAETEPLSSRAAVMKIYNRLIGELSAVDPGANGKSPNYVQQLSEVDISDPQDVKVTANDPGGTTVVHLGNENFLAHYKLYVAHIAEWRQQYQNLQSVDLRYEGQVVVNPDKEKAPEKPSPLINADNAGRKPVLKAVSTKPVSVKPVMKPAIHKAPVKAAARPAAKPAAHKAVAAKKAVHRGDAEARRKTN